MTILILNPNSSEAVTAGIDRAVAPLRASAPVPIAVYRLPDGPAGIETQAHAGGAVAGILAFARDHEADASAFVVACFSDPGLAALREQSARPVIGIAEAAILTAMQMGQRFGILSIRRGSVARHVRLRGGMGVLDRLAGDRALDLGVADLARDGPTFARLTEVGAELRDRDGADALILGCAGMTAYRARLSGTLGLPVVEPCAAAAAMAIGRVALSHSQRTETRP